jgi:hypothetical protein
MSLCTHKKWMVRQLKYLHNRLIWSLAGKHQTLIFKGLDIFGVNLVAMSESQPHRILFSVNLPSNGTAFEFNVPAAKSHIAAKAFNFFLFGQDIYYIPINI